MTDDDFLQLGKKRLKVQLKRLQDDAMDGGWEDGCNEAAEMIRINYSSRSSSTNNTPQGGKSPAHLHLLMLCRSQFPDARPEGGAAREDWRRSQWKAADSRRCISSWAKIVDHQVTPIYVHFRFM